jgi:hypothetical protein
MQKLTVSEALTICFIVLRVVNATTGACPTSYGKTFNILRHLHKSYLSQSGFSSARIIATFKERSAILVFYMAFAFRTPIFQVPVSIIRILSVMISPFVPQQGSHMSPTPCSSDLDHLERFWQRIMKLDENIAASPVSSTQGHSKGWGISDYFCLVLGLCKPDDTNGRARELSAMTPAARRKVFRTGVLKAQVTKAAQATDKTHFA